MISYYEKYERITRFQVENIEILELKSQIEEINIAEYTKKIFSMYGSEEESVRIQFYNSLLGVVIKKFGKNIVTYIVYENTFINFNSQVLLSI